MPAPDDPEVSCGDLGEASFDAERTVRQRNRTLAWLFAALTAVGGVATMLQFLRAWHGGFGIQLLVAGAIFTSRLNRFNWRAVGRTGRVTASRAGVAIDGELVAPASAIAHAFLQPTPTEHVVRLVDRFQRVLLDVVVADEAEAGALLRALGRDVGAARARFDAVSPLLSPRARSSTLAFVVLGLVAAASLRGIHVLPPGAYPWAFFVALAPLFAAWAVPLRVEIGADGVLLAWGWRRRFLAYDEIRAVDALDRGTVRFALTTGEAVDVVFDRAERRDKHRLVALRRDAVLARVRAALAAHHAGATAREIAARLARGERDRATWSRDLGALANDEGGYRAAALREDDLWRVVEDPGAPADARAAAAVLLRRSEDAAARARLRVAAEATASPKLRVALEAASGDGSDDEALEPFVEGEPKASRAG